MLARCVSTMLLRNHGSGTSNRDPSVVIHNDSRRRRDEKEGKPWKLLDEKSSKRK